MFDQVCVCRSQLLYCDGVTLHWPHLQYCRHKVFGSRRRCEQLQSLNEEYYVLSLLDVLLAQQRVRHLSCTQRLTSSSLLLLLDLSQPQPAEQVFNVYRREGHQFSVQTYNKLLLGWATQVKTIVLIFLAPPSVINIFILFHCYEQGNRLKAEVLFRNMAKDEVPPNPETYAVMFYMYTK